MKSGNNKLNSVGFKEFRLDAEKYISRVNKGESFTVFKRSRPIFKIVPVGEDESMWETIADFTTVNKEGVSARDIIKSLQRLNK